MVDVPLLRKVVEWVEEQAVLPKSVRLWDQAAWGCNTAMCVAMVSTERVEQGSSKPPYETLAADSSSNGPTNAGSGVGAGGGEATGSRSRHELSPWWLLIVVAGFLIAARVDVML